MSTEIPDREHTIARLIDDYNEAVAEEKEAASRADAAANDLRDLDVDVETDPRVETHA
jgi:hypothetical protein